MLVLRIATAGAALLLLTDGSTLTQPTGPGTAKPITLLKVLAPPDKTKIKPHGHRLGAPTWKTHVAAVQQKPRHLFSAAPAAATHADIWPAAESETAAEVASAEPEQQGATSTAESAPNELVVGGRAVQVVSPDDANEIDLAADSPEVPASKGPRSDVGERALTTDPPAETAVTGGARQPDPAGTSAWVAQLLAAIGGATAAASVAWFLIGSAPQRRYD